MTLSERWRKQRPRGQFPLEKEVCSDPIQLLSVFGPASCDAEGIACRLRLLPHGNLHVANALVNKFQSPSTVDWLSYLLAVCKHAEFVISSIQNSREFEREFGSRLCKLTRDEERTWTNSGHVLGLVFNVRERAVWSDHTFHESPFPDETKGLSEVHTRRALSRIAQWAKERLEQLTAPRDTTEQVEGGRNQASSEVGESARLADSLDGVAEKVVARSANTLQVTGDDPVPTNSIPSDLFMRRARPRSRDLFSYLKTQPDMRANVEKVDSEFSGSEGRTPDAVRADIRRLMNDLSRFANGSGWKVEKSKKSKLHKAEVWLVHEPTKKGPETD